VGHNAFGSTNNWPIGLRPIILRKISKTGATRCYILKLKCTKFALCWGSGPVPVGGAYSASPDPVSVFEGSTSREKEGKGRGGKGKRRKGKGGKRERRCMKGEIWSTQKCWRGAHMRYASRI